ncbi:MAG: nucleoside diphosphate kinase regulator [Spirochaetales bacterium]|nr:nucleoside diphosphate kinase regulator [Spirochaetales bacterium]
MEKRPRCFNAYDIDRIRGFLELATAGGSQRYRHLVGIRKDIEHAAVVAPEAVPSDVVTLNSQVRVRDLGSGQEVTITLVFPQEADYEQKKVSLLAPLGAALLGRHTGEEVGYEAPGGSASVRIEEILYQPEAAGDYSS